MADALEDFRHYTYGDYLEFPEKIRCELIRGEAYMMSSPSYRHQATVVDLCGQLRDFFKGKDCRVVVASFDVRLFPKEGEYDESDDTVVQPDLMVICDISKLEDEKAYKGAPDFIIEVLSRSTRSHDFLRKRSLYEEAGVKEYWIVGTDTVFKYVPAEGGYAETRHTASTEILDIPVDLFDGLILRFDPNIG